MENASKALIIAGAIILGILIIGLGMAVFNQAREATQNTNLDGEKIAAINAKFENYLGTTVRGTQVRALCETVKTNNFSEDADTGYQVKLVYGSLIGTDAESINKIKNQISTAKTYNVEPKYESNVITQITIK